MFVHFPSAQLSSFLLIHLLTLQDYLNQDLFANDFPEDGTLVTLQLADGLC